MVLQRTLALTSPEAEVRREPALLAYSVGAAALVLAAAVWLGEFAGTHRWPIHAAAIVLAVGYAIVIKTTRAGDPLTLLGLRRPVYTHWIWGLLFLGVVSGVARVAFYRATGLGGIALYEREFVPPLATAAGGELMMKAAAVAVFIYLAILIPGLLFCGVIQGPFSRARLFVCGLLLQSVAFGAVHVSMTGTPDVLYGIEAASGAVVYGYAYERLQNLYVPALFMWSSMLASLVMLLC